VTGVDQVYVGFGTPGQRALGEVPPDEARGYLEAGEFPAGSMGPKVESALQFLAGGGRRAVITSLPRLRDALAGRAGTSITRPDQAGSVRSAAVPRQRIRRSG
jgi:carbamate kinase